MLDRLKADIKKHWVSGVGFLWFGFLLLLVFVAFLKHDPYLVGAVMILTPCSMLAGLGLYLAIKFEKWQAKHDKD